MTKKEIANDKRLQKAYGITLKEYFRKLEEQFQCCALCGKHRINFKKSLHVDHNHKTKKVRGLVCFYCNNQLIRRHNLDTAKRLFEYMQKHEGKINGQMV